VLCVAALLFYFRYPVSVMLSKGVRLLALSFSFACSIKKIKIKQKKMWGQMGWL